MPGTTGASEHRGNVDDTKIGKRRIGHGRNANWQKQEPNVSQPIQSNFSIHDACQSLFCIRFGKPLEEP